MEPILSLMDYFDASAGPTVGDYYQAVNNLLKFTEKPPPSGPEYKYVNVMLESMYVTLVQTCTGGLAYRGDDELRTMVKSRMTKWELLAANLFTPNR